MKTNTKTVCVIVPAYNEATVIKDVIKQSKRVFAKAKATGYTIDVVLVMMDRRTTHLLKLKKVVPLQSIISLTLVRAAQP